MKTGSTKTLGVGAMIAGYPVTFSAEVPRNINLKTERFLAHRIASALKYALLNQNLIDLYDKETRHEEDDD